MAVTKELVELRTGCAIAEAVAHVGGGGLARRKAWFEYEHFWLGETPPMDGFKRVFPESDMDYTAGDWILESVAPVQEPLKHEIAVSNAYLAVLDYFDTHLESSPDNALYPRVLAYLSMARQLLDDHRRGRDVARNEPALVGEYGQDIYEIEALIGGDPEKPLLHRIKEVVETLGGPVVDQTNEISGALGLWAHKTTLVQGIRWLTDNYHKREGTLNLVCQALGGHRLIHTDEMLVRLAKSVRSSAADIVWNQEKHIDRLNDDLKRISDIVGGNPETPVLERVKTLHSMLGHAHCACHDEPRYGSSM